MLATVARGIRRALSLFAAALALSLSLNLAHAQSDALPSWNDGAAKAAITGFVAHVTTQGGPDFVPLAERIAVFDNDGTLWCEQPIYFQAVFGLDSVKAMAPKHPEWRQQQPFKAFLSDDEEGLAAQGEKGLLTLIAASHSGMTTDAYAQAVADWLTQARHPRFNRPYNELVYQPMVELLAYLRTNGFKTFIVSGGGVEFIRAWAEKAYGIPPEQVVGSSGMTQFKIGDDGRPILMKLPKVEFVDDGPGKPAGINRFIGRRPIFAFGNSDGDHQMLQWTAAGPGARFIGIVHHTDAQREYAYDRQSKIGRLDKAWDEAVQRGWTVVDMAKDWKTVFAFERGSTGASQ
ncbi:haloacid dehalogenase [Bradyrhizobium sp. LTSP849]|uniref:HAD family hydrolase n=1 Tax=Bradyrhizobium sp. LTSP849 TaxID=1615890 RepID=UPI0005D236BA|nr:HAD family hydrolase [Bradyrhizobium sp. LTSP849]KJC48650.1 haloacid dehalogenase [Bradyrhizobium sp. LTSP849]